MARFDPAEAPSLIAAARADAGLSQTELARRAHLTQPNLAAIESGRRRPSPQMLERILAAADYRPSVPLERHAAEIRASALRHGLGAPRLFGSVIRGEDHFDSDIDVVVDAPVGAGIVPLAELRRDIERLTGFSADVIASHSAAESELGRQLLLQSTPL